MEEKIILVDKNDNEIGFEEKIKVHKEGKLHRAFSIFIFNSKSELLIQKRSKKKYHSGGLWSNSCCGHPRSGENILDEANRRLSEEVGIKTILAEIFSFSYKINFNDGLIENEIDHVLVGFYDGKIFLNKHEVEDYKWISINELKEDMKKSPENYSYWFKLAFEGIMKSIIIP